MRYLILGQGGREHAIVRALTLSPTVSQIHCAPGSAGISREAICHDVDLADAAAVEAFVKRYRFDCVITSPDSAADVGDRLRTLGVAVVGPGAVATAFFERMSSPAPKDGERVSVTCLTDGAGVEVLPIVGQHRGHEIITVVAPVEKDESTRANFRELILTRVLKPLNAEHGAYRGVLTVDLVLSNGEMQIARVIAGFADPGAQVILPALEGDWGRVFLDLAHGRIEALRWTNASVACVVSAAPGTEESPILGGVIDGDLGSQTPSSYFLHAGITKSTTGQWIVGGPRVLNAIGLGNSTEEAVAAARAQAGRVNWRGLR